MTRAKKTDWAEIVIILLFILIPLTACADMKDLLLKFQPSITVEEQYSDNLDLAPRNRIGDFITTISPGLRFSTLPKAAETGQFRGTAGAPATAEEKYGIDLDYRLGLVYYAKETDRNFISHNGTLSAWYTPQQRLTFRIREYLIRSEEPRENDFAPGALPGQLLLGTQRQRSIYIRNVFEPSVEYRFGTENVASLNYRNNTYKNENRLVEGSQENFINPKLTYWFDIRNGISVEYGLTLADFDRSPDFTGHMVTGRYTSRFNPRTSVFGGYTFSTRDFKSPGIDYDIHRPSVGVEHRFSPTLSGRGEVGYFWQNPEKGSGVSGFFYDAGLTKRQERTTYALSLIGGYTEDFFTAENLGFTKYHRAIGTITHQLQERLTVGGFSSFELVKSEPEREDRIWAIGVNSSYRMLRWLTASLDVSRRENHAKDNDLSYREYRAIFRITATY